MTDKHPEALRLADLLESDNGHTVWQSEQAAAELRRLHMENADLKNACKIYGDALKEEKAVNAQLLEALEKAVKLNSFREFNDHIPPMKAAIAAAKKET